ncbi:hypothetical protein Mgra_00006419 [Meloidogyne graminicola]|uniref:Uncharacterized protein n=1 Tax=Meloidogyne graminicola TaxID=189291 RepID=A0A8S9ZL91_9BILA|nr:hypothetical protein Mgra_00006419 [Meloidogyne graminicola]
MFKQNQLAYFIKIIILSMFDLLMFFIGICFHGTSTSFKNLYVEFSIPYNFNKSIYDFFIVSSLRIVFLFTGCYVVFFNKKPSSFIGHHRRMSFLVYFLFNLFIIAKFFALLNFSFNNFIFKPHGFFYIGDVILLVSNFFFSYIAKNIWLELIIKKCENNYYKKLEEKCDAMYSNVGEEMVKYKRLYERFSGIFTHFVPKLPKEDQDNVLEIIENARYIGPQELKELLNANLKDVIINDHGVVTERPPDYYSSAKYRYGGGRRHPNVLYVDQWQ